MAPLTRKIDAERRMRDLLADNDMPQPDHVEYHHDHVRLYFDEPRVVIQIDLPPTDDD